MGKLCNCLARHTATLSGFGALFSPQEALEPAFLATLTRNTRKHRFASQAAGNGSRVSRDSQAKRSSSGWVLRPMAAARYTGMTNAPVARCRSRRCLAAGNPSPLQADDIRAHRQQNGDANSDNDQEEFSHCSASRRPQRKAAGIVLCREATHPCSQRPAIEAGPSEVEI